MDFTSDGRIALASCEFSGELVRIDLRRRRVVGIVHLQPGAMPQDVKLSPDGRVFYVADMMGGGVWEISAARDTILGFVKTGAGAHGLYPSRNARLLYVSNRSASTISVLSFRSHRVVRTWRIPHGSPDMGGVSANGRVLWLSGRYSREVYAIDTANGHLLARIPVGAADRTGSRSGRSRGATRSGTRGSSGDPEGLSRGGARRCAGAGAGHGSPA